MLISRHFIKNNCVVFVLFCVPHVRVKHYYYTRNPHGNPGFISLGQARIIVRINLILIFYYQVSFWSTSPELSNKQRFEYFTRTIPSDLYQVKVMVEIVRKLGWTYISIIYEESSYGIKAFEELEKLLPKHNICIAVKEKLVKDSGVAEEKAYDDIVIKLLGKPRAKGKNVNFIRP